ncbi:hypothetical protein BC827DRAFT_1199781 [Russula dissimulans]|nr:hypothetical protein BC827DRAFT_1199781 [Russula dissimulans]
MSSSETTQILFNSPALHSLKHNQLAKLCKIHSIKASGKKVELIQRLKDHAATLPHGSPLSVATRSEQLRDDKDSKRPSEQWELLMEDIPELPEGSSRQTLSSLRSVSGTAPDEFGTGGGSKSSSMSSSLRAIATTFNFKHAPSNKPDDDDRTAPDITDELASHSVPYSSIPEPPQSDMPQTDHFKFSTPDSTIDEHIRGLPGHPAALALATSPSGSSAGPPRTTIRLVSASNSTSTLSPLEPGTPQLRPVEPRFDIVMGSPDAKGQNRVPVWPLSPQPESSERLYPVLAVNELDEAKQHQAKSTLSGKSTPSQAPASSTKAKVYPRPSNDVQDIFSPAPKPPGTQERVGIPRSEPFLFGSPLPSHRASKKAFENAAASVLEEMNKRLSAAGVQKVGADVFGTIPAATADSGNSREPSRVDRFDKAHEGQFNKMDSIATHYAARRGAKKRKSDVLGHGSGPAAKRSSASVRVSSTASRKRMGIPGGFDDGEEEEATVDEVQEEEDRRMSKRVRVLEDDGGKDKGRRLTISPSKTEAEEKQAERERAATRKMLQLRKEKRRSSRHGGRASLAGPQAASNKGKATPRFGFLSSAKSIVRSVWNFGVGSPTKASRTNAAATSAMTRSKTVGAGADAAESKETTKPKPALSKKPSLAPPRPSESLSLGGRRTVAPARGWPTTAASTTTLSRKSSSGDASREKGTVGRSHSRQPNGNTNAGAKLHNSSRPSQSVRASSANVSSAKVAGVSSSNNKSAGTGIDTTGEGTGGDNSNNDKRPTMIFSPSSRLFAPTASSLAKIRGPSKTSAIVAAQRAKTPSSPPRDDCSPRQDGKKIFTTPLMLLPNPNQTVIPPPVKPTSLAAAATALATTTTTATATAAQSQSPKSEQPLAAAGYSSPKMTTTTTKTSAGRPGSARKPRISRSRIIAKLGAQRATTNENSKNSTDLSSYASSSSSLSRPPPAAAVVVAGPGSRIPRASGSSAVLRTSRVRSSMGTATRRSYAGAKSASRGSDVLMSAKKHARQSEYVRRRSRLVGSAVGAAAGEGPAADGRDPDGSTAMDIDED